jgi:hypothetical protein
MRNSGNETYQYRETISHSIGISNSYYRPTDTELLDILKVSDLLMIDKQGKLQKDLHKYEQKNLEEVYAIKGKLPEREEIESLKETYESDMTLFQEKVDVQKLT